MGKFDGVLESLKSYGFAIISDEHKELLDNLRTAGIIHFFIVRKLNNYTILEPNTLSCERECNVNCRDGNGVVKGDCYGECIDMCVMDKLSNIIMALSRA
ncbi:MAG: hypothetical protein QW775_04025 [Ignisphaera sp.]|uniref:Uncharacterized protein n=1 Tax=Ignisphaera aggregans TaxID=334771 RepID=A0A7C4NK72_9CREN